jgi:hypothetical protein
MITNESQKLRAKAEDQVARSRRVTRDFLIAELELSTPFHKYTNVFAMAAIPFGDVVKPCAKYVIEFMKRTTKRQVGEDSVRFIRSWEPRQGETNSSHCP